MGGGAPARRVSGLDAGRHLGVGHHGGDGGRRVGAEFAGNIELDHVDALAQAKPRHAPHLVGPVAGDDELCALVNRCNRGEGRDGER